MYSWEIEQLMRLRENLIKDEEYIKIIRTSPQIKWIEYKPNEDNFYISTDDNYNFKFKILKKEKK